MEYYEAIHTYEPIFGSWYVKDRIGGGSFGDVFLAEKESGGIQTYSAIKFIRIPKTREELRAKMENGMTREDATSYFRSLVDDMVREIRIMSQLKGCANIVSYENHEIYPHEDGKGWDILIQMELLTPLRTYFEKNPLTEQSVMRLGIDICNALVFCEKKDIIHRDIKPGNIMVSPNGEFKLGDFGIARTMDKTVSMMSRNGTEPYMAPEIFRCEEYGRTVDIYSLGIVLYQLLNGRTPFLPVRGAYTVYDEQQAQARRFRGDPLPEPVNGSPELKRIVLKACAPNPADRYSSAGQMRDELLALLYSTPAAPATGAPPRPTTEIADTATVLMDQPGTPQNGRTGAAAAISGTELEDRETVLLDDNAGQRPGVHVQPRKKLRWLPIAIGVAVVALGAFAVSRFGSGVNERKPKQSSVVVTAAPRGTEAPKQTKKPAASTPAPEKTEAAQATPDVTEPPTEATPEPTPEATPAPTPTPLSFSNWDALPAAVKGEQYAIEARQFYRSSQIQNATLTTAPGPDFTTTKVNTEYGAWSAWQDTPITATETLEVQTRTTEARWSDWSAWSAWISVGKSLAGVPGKSDTFDVETSSYEKNNESHTATWTEYQYHTRTRTLLPGSTQYSSRTVKKSYTGYYTKWTAYTDSFIPLQNGVTVSMATKYRYADVEKDRPADPSMDHFRLSDRNYVGHYADVAANKWYSPANSKALQTADELGILWPDAGMCIAPEKGMTVGELIRAAVIVNRTYQGYTGLLCAINGGNEIYADYAASHGLIEKSEYTNLAKAATVEDMAAILSRALPEECLGAIRPAASVSDMDKNSKAYDGALTLARAGVLDAGEDGTIRPTAAVTRAQVADLIERLVHPDSRTGA